MHPIARYRLGQGWTQTELAQQAGVSLAAVQGWERGVRPRPRHLGKLAELFGVPGLDLLDEIARWQPEGKAAV